MENVFSLPQGAIRQRPDGTYSVYVMDNGLAREREVTLSHWEGTQWIVTSGLKAGDKVIVDQILRLRDKLPVAEKKVEPAAVEAESGAAEAKA